MLQIRFPRPSLTYRFLDVSLSPATQLYFFFFFFCCSSSLNLTIIASRPLFYASPCPTTVPGISRSRFSPTDRKRGSGVRLFGPLITQTELVGQNTKAKWTEWWRGTPESKKKVHVLLEFGTLGSSGNNAPGSQHARRFADVPAFSRYFLSLSIESPF